MAQIPQEIIDNIADELWDDADALDSCAIVCRSFLIPSRRNLFSDIYLNSVERLERLHRLLVSKPDLANYIRELTFVASFVSAEDKYLWLSSLRDGRTLPGILRLIRRLQILSWGIGTSVPWGATTIVSWGDFSPELQIALLDILRSPSLRSIELSNLYRLPISIINFPHVRKLFLTRVGFEDPVEPLPVTNGPHTLSKLEFLELRGAFGMQPQVVASISNLRYLLIQSSDETAGAFIQQIIHSSSRSLEQIWLNCPPSYGVIVPTFVP